MFGVLPAPSPNLLEEGANTLVIAMSYGERGESGELWKEDPKRSVESVKVIRHEQAQHAADIYGHIVLYQIIFIFTALKYEIELFSAPIINV